MTSEDGPLLLRMTLLATSSDNLRQIKTKVIQKTLQVNVVKFFFQKVLEGLILLGRKME